MQRVRGEEMESEFREQLKSKRGWELRAAERGRKRWGRQGDVRRGWDQRSRCSSFPDVFWVTEPRHGSTGPSPCLQFGQKLGLGKKQTDKDHMDLIFRKKETI